MPKRRVLRGKKLLVAAGIAGASFIGCSEQTVANLVAPPDSGAMDASEPMDATTFPLDAPVANLVAPVDSGFDSGFEAGEDAGSEDDAGEPSDAQVIGFPDAPIANLVPPPPEK